MSIVYGINAVRARLDQPGSIRLIVRSDNTNKRVMALEEEATQIGLPINRIPKDEFALMIDAEKADQGVLLEVSQEQPRTLEEVLTQRDERKHRLLLVLDGVTDPGNLGACLRSAATMGVEAVVVPKDGSADLNDIALKRSAGGGSAVPFIRVTNLGRSIAQMKEAGFWLVGTQLDAEKTIQDIDFKENIVLVMGSEGRGIRSKTAKACDFLASIPMIDNQFGFNVSVATGICLYEIQRQRIST